MLVVQGFRIETGPVSQSRGHAPPVIEGAANVNACMLT